MKNLLSIILILFSITLIPASQSLITHSSTQIDLLEVLKDHNKAIAVNFIESKVSENYILEDSNFFLCSYRSVLIDSLNIEELKPNLERFTYSYSLVLLNKINYTRLEKLKPPIELTNIYNEINNLIISIYFPDSYDLYTSTRVFTSNYNIDNQFILKPNKCLGSKFYNTHKILFIEDELNSIDSTELKIESLIITFC